ncbi:hypothetical protein K493DRAFT_410662 [Basidiobolus meristosporus CBS 931.73]|uniref:Uncharacterized protein n=1 Tax=Basidiobolus meristosporus CBS 931.73 TaxID=1314790 RepID=A0A1Y1XTH9_9FUNG|nr:hypothetical protein K493DRAFT_410662 [Basidiobolus meristosporus CBS 931.73]|eukprot:ORX89061.1 hypothetical protein K493DRAFT_410662 [Basidiobolus meristosporus CBS 931.73]
MTANLLQILNRLIEEKLDVPSHSPNALRRHASYSSLLSSEIDESEQDARDSRWEEYFIEFFLEKSDSRNDDLLFFVRQRQTNNRGLDPVFVKRKLAQPNPMPPLEDPVLWRETFFLNLIVQLPCSLTVAVCKRNTDNSTTPGLKTSMTCTWKHVSKRVYALPSKSRMNTKDSNWECSYPLIYYVIEDYEDAFEQLIIKEGEYLCVELAVGVADGDNEGFGEVAENGNHSGKKTTSDGKITLFQGAASYSALLDLYRQKASNKIKSRFALGPSVPPTEYVMMRGPGAKGHAQVAITASVHDDKEPEQPNATKSYPPSPVSSNSRKNTSPFSPANVIQSIKRLSSPSTLEKQLQEPVNLKCCMTFVNVPWKSIVSDLATHARKKKVLVA